MSSNVTIDPNFADALARNGRENGEKPTATAIIDAAEELFLEHGFHATRVSEVARLADVSIGSIYVHYDNKEGLFAALIDRALDTEARYFDAALESTTLSDFEKILALGEAYLQFFRDHPGYFRLLMLPVDAISDEATRSPLVRQIFERGAAQRKRLARVIENCVEQGVLRDDVDSDRAANFWWAAWTGVIALTMRNDELGIDEDEMERVIVVGRLMIAEGLASRQMREGDGQIVDVARRRLLTLEPAPQPLKPDES